MPINEIQQLLATDPPLEPYLRRVVRHAAKKSVLPPTIILGPIDTSLLPQLNRLLAGRCRIERERIVLKLPLNLRSAERWQPLVAALQALDPTTDDNTAVRALETTFKRLRLLFPTERPLIELLEDDKGWCRFIANNPTRTADCINLIHAWQRLQAAPGITLSQLGSDCFNDSKALRSGILLGLLERLLRLSCDQPDLTSAELHLHCGIIENPYTSHVSIFAPFGYTTDDGRYFDHPRQLFAAGQAVILPWESIRRISTIDHEITKPLITSENAVPFLELIRTGKPALYTAGYPNTAVRTLLKHLAAQGVTVAHAGDTDLDGYRIAAQIGEIAPLTTLLTLSDLKNLPHKALTEPQRLRLEQFIARHPHFLYTAQLKHTLQHGWVEQETWLAHHTPPHH